MIHYNSVTRSFSKCKKWEDYRYEIQSDGSRPRFYFYYYTKVEPHIIEANYFNSVSRIDYYKVEGNQLFYIDFSRNYSCGIYLSNFVEAERLIYFFKDAYDVDIRGTGDEYLKGPCWDNAWRVSQGSVEGDILRKMGFIFGASSSKEAWKDNKDSILKLGKVLIDGYYPSDFYEQSTPSRTDFSHEIILTSEGFKANF